MQPCPAYNDINTKDWYAGEDRKDPSTGKPQSRVSTNLQDTGFDPVVHDESEVFKKKVAGMEKAQEWGDRIPIGVFYKNPVGTHFPRPLRSNAYPSTCRIRLLNSSSKTKTAFPRLI